MDHSTERDLDKLRLARFADRIDEWVLNQLAFFGGLFRTMQRVYGLQPSTLAALKLDEKNIRQRRRWE